MTASGVATIESTPDLLPAFSYIRVSTMEQAERDGDPEGYSIPAQRAANQRKAASIGAVIVEEFLDRGESARSANRPDLQRMLVAAKKVKPTYVIVHKVDRLARNRVDDVEINLALHKAGATLVSATENIDQTPSGMLLHGIMSTIAEFYSRNLATEVIKGMNQKALTGGTPNRAPLGYRNVGVISSEGREVRSVIEDPERGPLIAWAFTAYASGQWTLQNLALELEARGLTSLPTPRRAARPIPRGHLHQILTNPYYKGVVVWNGAEYPDGRHPRLVSSDVWQQVQDMLASHAVGEKQRDHPHYLKSSVFCGDCGSRLIITNARNRYGTVYPYFICLGRHQKTTSCTRKAVLIARVEELVEEEYRSVQIPTDLRNQIESNILDDAAATRSEAERQQLDLDRQRTRLINQRSKLLQAHYAGAVPLDLLKSEQDRIAQQLTLIDSSLQATATTFETLASNLRGAMDLLENCHLAYERASDRDRRLLNQALFTKIFVHEDDVEVELAQPFAGIAAMDVGEAFQSDLTGPPAGPGERWYIASHMRKRGNEKPAPSVAGLKDTRLVPLVGFEPTTHGLGNRCSIP